MLCKEAFISGKKSRIFLFPAFKCTYLFHINCQKISSRDLCMLQSSLQAFLFIHLMGFFSLFGQDNLCCYFVKTLPFSSFLCPRGRVMWLLVFLASKKPGWRLHAEDMARACCVSPYTLPLAPCLLISWRTSVSYDGKSQLLTKHTSPHSSFLPGHISDNNLTVALHTLLH